MTRFRWGLVGIIAVAAVALALYVVFTDGLRGPNDQLATQPTDSPAEAVAPQAPQVVIRTGVVNTQNPALVMQKTRARIAANEARIKKALVPMRIVKVQLLGDGEFYETDSDGGGMAPNDGPGWIVEVIGTIVEDGHEPNTVFVGVHGFYRWDDAGSEGSSFVECWRGDVSRVAEAVATCAAPT